MIAAVGRESLLSDFWKLSLYYQNGPQENNAAENQLRPDHSHRFLMKIGIECFSRLHCLTLTLSQFNTREDKSGSDEHADDRSNGIECLTEIQPPRRTGGISQLRNKR